MASPSIEDYIKAIYKAQADTEKVTTQDVAARVHVSAPAVSKMLKRLTELRLVTHTPYHGVRLTEPGEKMALEIIRHHRLLERYLVQALGYGWEEVHQEAERLEHHISEDFEERIDALLGHPTTCPHGDPIPTREGVIAPQRGKPLTDSEPGETLIVLRVRDNDPEVLRYLSRLGVRLEKVLHLKEKQPFNGSLVFDMDGATHSVGRDLADQVFVESCSKETQEV